MNKNQLFFAMERKDYSPEELARLSGVSVSVIKKALDGDEKALSLAELGDIKEALGLTNDTSGVREALPVYKGKRYTVEDYRALPDDERYELIDGELIRMDAPSVNHQVALSALYFRIALYIEQNKGPCEVYFAPCDVQLDMDQFTMLQPDLFIICDEDKYTKRCIYGAPDFVLEILSPSTEKKDLNLKLRKYRLAGVKEYWAVDIEKRLVYVFRFKQNDEAIQVRAKEKRFGVTLLEEDEEPVIYTGKDVIPVGIYNGELKIDMGEIFAKLKDI